MAASNADALLTARGPSPGAWLMPDTLEDHLQLIADGVLAVAGFAVAAIRIRRGDELELVVDTGSPEHVGTRIPLALMVDELLLADDWGSLQFVPHERGSRGPTAGGWIVPDVTISTAPGAWHPLDMLVAPLYDELGELRGTLAIDEPIDGRRPGPERRRVLERFAALASRAVLSAVERDAFAEQVAMANTVKEVVRTASAQLSLDGLLAASEHTLAEGFRADGLWIQTVIGDDRAGRMSGPAAGLELPPAIVEFAETSASYCWHHQLVVTVGVGLPVPPMMEAGQFHDIVELLKGIEMSSLIFVPLGAGPEHMGSLVLTRRDSRREWSDIERSALLDIGHDLGRATLNARTFEREHALVAELQGLDTYKSQLVATVSHELKSPLTTVAGHLEMLESDTIGVGDEARPSLAAIGRASQRMSRMIDDLLLLRKVGESAKPLGHESVDLVELVHDAVAMTTLLAESKSLTVAVVVPEHPVLGIGERSELDKVVLNVVNNAVKYTPEGRHIWISLEQGPDTVTIRVADEGLGISEKDRPQLFTEFFRSSNPEAVAQPGTGLGLAIVKRIVERHHGRIEVESTLGRGSTFTVTLPLAGEPARSSRVHLRSV